MKPNLSVANRLPATLLALLMLTGCVQKKTSVLPQNHHLNCILMGYDSLIFYYGDGKQIEQLKTGNIRDSAFMNDIFRTIKSLPPDPSFRIRIKPTAAGDAGENFMTLVDMLNVHDVQGRSIDTLFPIEQRTFYITSPSRLIESKNHPVLPLQPLPENASTKDKSATPDIFTLFLAGDDVLYGFMGKDMQKGETYTTESLSAFLRANKGTANFTVRLRASVKSSYKMAVDMLDAMQQNGIQNYSFDQMTKDQERFLNIKMQQAK